MNAHLLSLRGEQARTLYMCLISVMILLLMCALLAPIWGVLGVAAAVLAADSFWAVALGVLARRVHGSGGDIVNLLFDRHRSR